MGMPVCSFGHCRGYLKFSGSESKSEGSDFGFLRVDQMMVTGRKKDMHTEQSETLYKKACTLMPGGVNSPVRAFRSVGRTPLFIRSAKGDKLLDEDGNEWIDYVCSWGPGILGHAHPVVVEKVRQAALDGLTFGAPTKKETELEHKREGFLVRIHNGNKTIVA